MFEVLIMFIPEEAYLVALVAAGILMICGARRLALSLFVTVLLLAMLGPCFDVLMEALPPFVLVIISLVCLVSIFKMIVGQRVAGNLASFVLYDIIRAPFRFIGWLIGGLFRRPL